MDASTNSKLNIVVEYCLNVKKLDALKVNIIYDSYVMIRPLIAEVFVKENSTKDEDIIKYFAQMRKRFSSFTDELSSCCEIEIRRKS